MSRLAEPGPTFSPVRDTVLPGAVFLMACVAPLRRALAVEPTEARAEEG